MALALAYLNDHLKRMALFDGEDEIVYTRAVSDYLITCFKKMFVSRFNGLQFFYMMLCFCFCFVFKIS